MRGAPILSASFPPRNITVGVTQMAHSLSLVNNRRIGNWTMLCQVIRDNSFRMGPNSLLAGRLAWYIAGMMNIQSLESANEAVVLSQK
jgi:hypothetical protein